MRNTVGADLDLARQALDRAATTARLDARRPAPAGVADEAHRVVLVELGRLLDVGARDLATPSEARGRPAPVDREVAAERAGALRLRDLLAEIAPPGGHAAPSDVVDAWRQAERGEPRRHAVLALADAATSLLTAAETAAGPVAGRAAYPEGARTLTSHEHAGRALLMETADVVQGYARASLSLGAAGHLPPATPEHIAALLASSDAVLGAARGRDVHPAWLDVHSPPLAAVAAVDRPGQLPAALQRLTTLLDRQPLSNLVELKLVASSLALTAGAGARLVRTDPTSTTDTRLDAVRHSLDHAVGLTSHYRSTTATPGRLTAQSGEIARVAVQVLSQDARGHAALGHALARTLPAPVAALRASAQRLVEHRQVFVDERYAALLGNSRSDRLPGRWHLARDLGELGRTLGNATWEARAASRSSRWDCILLTPGGTGVRAAGTAVERGVAVGPRPTAGALAL